MNRPTPDTPSTPGSTSAPLRPGEILVRQRVLTAAQVGHLLDVQAATHRPFGDLAERLFGIEPKAVIDAWVEQTARRCVQADVDAHACDPSALALLTARQAWQFRVVPVRFEPLGHARAVLVAVERDNLLRGMNFLQRTLPAAPSLVVAEPASLRRLLARVYPVSPAMQQHAYPAAAATSREGAHGPGHPTAPTVPGAY